MKFPGKRLIIEYKNRRARKNVKSLWGDINIKEIARAVEDDTTMPAAKNSDVPPTKAAEQSFPKDRAANRPAIKATGQVTEDQPVAAKVGGRILSAMQGANPDASRQAQHPARAKQRPVSERPKAPQHEKTSQSRTRPSTPLPIAEKPEPVVPDPSEPVVVLPASAPVAAPQQDRAVSAPDEPLALENGTIVKPAPETQSRPAPTHASEAQTVQSAPKPPAPRTKPLRAGKPSSPTPQPASPSNDAVMLFYRRPAPVSDDLSALESENNHLKELLASKLRAENRRLKKMIARAISPIDDA